jgi:hypothetical protein
LRLAQDEVYSVRLAGMFTNSISILGA